MARDGVQMHPCERMPAKGEPWCTECVATVMGELAAAEGRTVPLTPHELIFSDASSVDDAGNNKEKLQKAARNALECSHLDGVKLVAPAGASHSRLAYQVVYLKTAAGATAVTAWKSPCELAPGLLEDFHERTVRTPFGQCGVNGRVVRIASTWTTEA